MKKTSMRILRGGLFRYCYHPGYRSNLNGVRVVIRKDAK
jgi:hypothetical protein